jgi:hypothetical protein
LSRARGRGHTTFGGGDVSGATGSYRLRLTNIPSDPNDQIAQAGAAAVGGAARTGSIDDGTDVDMFAVTAGAGHTVGIDLDRTAGSTLDSVLRLFNAAGDPLAVNNNKAGPGEPATTGESYLEYRFETAGTYYAGVSSFLNFGYDPVTGANDDGSATGGYTLRLSNPPAPAPAALRVQGVKPETRLSARVVDDILLGTYDADEGVRWALPG